MAAYTWTGAASTAYATAANWTPLPPLGFPQPADTITFSGGVNCDLGGANRTVQGVTFSSYTGTLALTGNLIVNGNVAFQAGAMNVSGTNALIIGNNSTITPNGGSWLGNLTIGSGTASIVVTLVSGFSVSGTITFVATVSLVGTFFITALGDVVASTNCIVSTPNANQTTLVLAGLTSKWSGDGRLGCNITFNSLGSNFIIENNVVFGSVVLGSASPQLNFTSGASVTTTGSTLTLVGSVQLSVQTIVFNNVNFASISNVLWTISLIQDLVVGGNLVVGVGGSAAHQISRSAEQKIFVRGNLQVGTSNTQVNSINAAVGVGGEIVIQGNPSTTSTLSCFGSGVGANWCNINVTIDATTNNVALSTTNEFNFGNPSSAALTPRRFKYTSGNFSAAGSTINLVNSILDLGAAQFNNVRIYGLNNSSLTVNVQLQTNTTITGNLLVGGLGGAAIAVLTLPTAGSATTLTIGGGLTIVNPLGSSAISLNFVGSGTISGAPFCNANININSGTYTVTDFYFGNNAVTGGFGSFLPTFKYNGGSLNFTGTIFTANVKFDLGAIQLNNLTTTISAQYASGYTITIVAGAPVSNILRVNGNYVSSIQWTGLATSPYGTTTINADSTTPNAQLDVYGNVTMCNNNSILGGTFGNSKIYMKGTGTFTTNGQNGCGIDVYLQGNVTLGQIWITNSKRLEYISGTLNIAGSLTTFIGTATLKSLGQLWGDIGVRGNSNAVFDGNINCRDLIAYSDGGSATYLAGVAAGVEVTIRRNLTLGNTSPLLSTNNQPVGTFAVSKLIMTAAASDGGVGTWTSNAQRLAISLDLNAPTRTIQLSGQVFFGNTVATTLTWFPTTIINALSGTILNVINCSLDLGNQLWGGLVAGANVAIHLISDAKFTNVTLGAAAGQPVNLNGITTPKILTITGSFTNNQANIGVFTANTFQPVKIIFDGSGTWSGVGATQLDVDLLSGTRTLSGTVTWGGGAVGGNKTIQSTGGSISGGSSTFVIPSSSTINIDKATRGSFFNVTTGAGITLTLNAQMGALGTLALSSTAANITTFASSSTFGWDAGNFTHGGGDTTCILNAGTTYNISGTLTIIGSSNTTRATLRSSKLSTFNLATANGTTLTSAGVGGSPVEVGMVLSQASVVASGGFAAIYPNRPILTSASGSPFTLNPSFPVTPSVGPVNMEAGIKANLNLAVSTGNALVLNVTTKDINSIGGQTIYAFNSYLDAAGNPQANMFRTINWNTLAPPVSPIGIGFLSVT